MQSVWASVTQPVGGGGVVVLVVIATATLNPLRFVLVPTDSSSPAHWSVARLNFTLPGPLLTSWVKNRSAPEKNEASLKLHVTALSPELERKRVLLCVVPTSGPV